MHFKKAQSFRLVFTTLVLWPALVPRSAVAQPCLPAPQNVRGYSTMGVISPTISWWGASRTLMWDPVPNATGYEIYRSLSPDPATRGLNPVGEREVPSFTDGQLFSWSRYPIDVFYYWVKPKDGCKTNFSAATPVGVKFLSKVEHVRRCLEGRLATPLPFPHPKISSPARELFPIRSF